MRGLPEEDTRAGVSPLADVEKLVVEGRYGRAELALRRLEALIPGLASTADTQTLLLALYGRALLVRQLGATTQDAIAACDVLERAAHERDAQLWVATACATRARFRVDSGDIGGATADLARADAEAAGGDLTGDTGYRLLDGLALVYAGLRLNDRADEVRDRIEQSIGDRRVLDQAQHWSTWSGELAARAMEPLAGGAQDPEHELMARAIEIAAKLDGLPEKEVPSTLRRGARGVRALSAAYRGRPSEALRLLGPDAFGTVGDLPLVERQIVSLAAMRAHALVGSLATARSLDDAATTSPATLPNLVLEVCRTRERLWLETYAGGDVIPVLHRMTELLVRLGWRGMDLVADTARQALEHQALRTESRTDALTGVGNRRALDEELRQLLRFGPLPLALILVDVDRFKEVNDVFTHVIGDEVLRRVAGSLSLQLRTDDQLLRYGGDEFVVLLPGTGDDEAEAVAQRMRSAVSARPWHELADGLEVSITTGVAAVWSLSGRRPDADAEKLFRRADERLLEGKRNRPEEPAGRSRAALQVGDAPVGAALAIQDGDGPASGSRVTGPLPTGPLSTGSLSTGPLSTGLDATGLDATGLDATGLDATGPIPARSTVTGPTLNGSTATGPVTPESKATGPIPTGPLARTGRDAPAAARTEHEPPRPTRTEHEPPRPTRSGHDTPRPTRTEHDTPGATATGSTAADRAGASPTGSSGTRPADPDQPHRAGGALADRDLEHTQFFVLDFDDDGSAEPSREIGTSPSTAAHAATGTGVTARPERRRHSVFDPDPDDDPYPDARTAGRSGGRRDGSAPVGPAEGRHGGEGPNPIGWVRSRREARAADRPLDQDRETSAGRDAAEVASAAREVARADADAARARAAREARARDDAIRDSEIRARADREKAQQAAERARQRAVQERSVREAAGAAARQAAELDRHRHAERERAGRERAERERAEEQRIEQQRAEQQRTEQQRADRERAEQQRIEQERAEQERAEQDRAEQQRTEQQRADQERAEQQRIEQERAARERAERERAEREGLAARREVDRRERERAEAQRIEAQRIEAERIEAQRIEAQRIEAQRIEAQRIKAQRVEARRIEAERIEAQRVEAQRIEAERAARERRERREQERLAQEQRDRVRREQERIEAERLARQRREQERVEAEAREARRLEREARDREQEAARAAAVAQARARAEAEVERARASERIREEAYARAAEQARRALGERGSAPGHAGGGHERSGPDPWDRDGWAAPTGSQPLQRRAALYDTNLEPEDPLAVDLRHDRRSHPRISGHPTTDPLHGAGAIPTGAMPTGAMPNGSMPTGAMPNGGLAHGSAPHAAGLNGTPPQAAGQNGTPPHAAGQNGTPPHAAGQNGTWPTGAVPTGSLPTGSLPTGASAHGSAPHGSPSPGTMPTGSVPNGSVPTGSMPTRAVRTASSRTDGDTRGQGEAGQQSGEQAPDGAEAPNGQTGGLRLRREPFGPPTRSQAIIDLSARKRPRSPYTS